MCLGDDCRSSASPSVILRFSGGRCRARPWMSLPLDQSASVETKPSDLLPAGYTPHGQHSGSPEGEGARGISQPQTRPSLSRPFRQRVACQSQFALCPDRLWFSLFSQGWVGPHAGVARTAGGGGLTAPGTDFQRVRGPHTRTHVQRRGDQFPSLSRVPCCGRFSSCGLCSLWAEVSASLSLPNSLPLVRPSAFSVSRRSLACFRRASSFLLPVRLSGCRQRCRWRACDAQLSQEAGRPGSWQPGFRGADTPGVGSGRRPTGGSPPSKWMGRAACGPSLRKSPALETQQAPALDVNDLRRIWGYNIIVKRRALRTR